MRIHSLEDTKLVLSFDKLLQNIGEAARALPDAGKARCPDVPWKLVIGTRNKFVHEYFRASPGLLWVTAGRPVDDLILAIEPAIAKLLSESPEDLK